MKKISPADAERLGELLKEMGKIFNQYKISSLVTFQLDENKHVFSCSGNIPDTSYLFAIMVKDLCRRWKVRKKYFIDIIKKRYRNQLPIFGELSASLHSSSSETPSASASLMAVFTEQVMEEKLIFIKFIDKIS
jgi:hypothetical protein